MTLKFIWKFGIAKNVNVSAKIQKGKCVWKMLCLGSSLCLWAYENGKCLGNIVDNWVICDKIIEKKLFWRKLFQQKLFQKTLTKRKWFVKRKNFIFYLLLY